ncbi:MAG: hypothetical protein MHMPM18_001486 [Marteilia pararefringens]
MELFKSFLDSTIEKLRASVQALRDNEERLGELIRSDSNEENNDEESDEGQVSKDLVYVIEKQNEFNTAFKEQLEGSVGIYQEQISRLEKHIETMTLQHQQTVETYKQIIRSYEDKQD